MAGPTPGRVAGELGGAFGDLGTLLPHTLGAITVAGLSPAGVLAGCGIFYVVTGLFYRLPIPVQPMRAVSAVLLTSGLSAGEIAAAGLCLGLILLVLGATGAIGWFARIVPQSVMTGLQLGLGITLALREPLADGRAAVARPSGPSRCCWRRSGCRAAPAALVALGAAVALTPT